MACGSALYSGHGQAGEEVHWLRYLDTVPSSPGKGCPSWPIMSQACTKVSGLCSERP